jgi:hypothetical protein
MDEMSIRTIDEPDPVLLDRFRALDEDVEIEITPWPGRALDVASLEEHGDRVRDFRPEALAPGVDEPPVDHRTHPFIMVKGNSHSSCWLDSDAEEPCPTSTTPAGVTVDDILSFGGRR